MKKATLIKVILLLGILLSAIVYYNYKNSWKGFISNNELNNLITQIKKSDSLPNLFYDLYNVKNSNTLERDITYSSIKNLFSEEYYPTPSSWVAKMNDYIYVKNANSLVIKRNEYSLTWQIEDKTNQMECLNWIAKNFDFGYSNIGVESAATYYFKKDLRNLNSFEMACIIIMLDNPMLYNPKKRKDLLQDKANILLKKYLEINTVPNNGYNSALHTNFKQNN